MRQELWITRFLPALLLAGCSLVIDSGEFTGGERDGGTADTGTADAGTADAGMDTGGTGCMQCTDDEIMLDTGHCVLKPMCMITCPPGQVCDPFFPGACYAPLPCPDPLPPGIVCSDYGPVPECACPEGTSRPFPDGPAECLPCGEGDHYVSPWGVCVPGTERCVTDDDCTVPGETCASRFPGDDMYCANDSAPPHCVCGSGQICRADGNCVENADCVDEPGPSCADDARPGPVPPLRVLGLPFDTDMERMERTDLHITSNPLSTGMNNKPGWTMYWRRGGGTIEAAFASVQRNGDDNQNCYDVRPLPVSGGCSLPTVDMLDARTIDGTRSPIHAFATVEPDSSSDGSVITLSTVGATEDPARTWIPNTFCLTPRDGPATGPTITGLSLVPVGPAVSVDTAVNGTQRLMARYPGSTMRVSRPVLRGDVAAGPYSTLFVRSGRGLTRFFGNSAVNINLQDPAQPVDRASPVAAINAEATSDPEHFLVPTQGGGVVRIDCRAPSMPPAEDDCDQDYQLISLMRIADSPIAGYSFFESATNEHTVAIAVVGADSGFGTKLTHCVDDLLNCMDLLTPAMVGGTIEQVLALDAESIREISAGGRADGWNHVWAAFIVVNRDGNQALELWTGVAFRQCS